MTSQEMQKRVADFAAFWADRGDEKQHSQKFWIGLLRCVCACVAPERVIDFEERVKIGATKYIDGYIAETRTIIEQKGAKIDLDAKEKQSDGSVLTPFEQAKRYADELPNSLRPRWIAVCNFREFLIYDLENPHDEPQQIFLKDLPRDCYRLAFLVDQKNENIRREEEISIQAGKLVDKLYQALLPQYIPQTARHSERSEESMPLGKRDVRLSNARCLNMTAEGGRRTMIGNFPRASCARSISCVSASSFACTPRTRGFLPQERRLKIT